MNVTQVGSLQINRSRQASRSPPAENFPPLEMSGQTDAFAPPEGPSATSTSRDSTRGDLIVLGFVAAAPIVVGAWLWLLGWIALAIL